MDQRANGYVGPHTPTHKKKNSRKSPRSAFGVFNASHAARVRRVVVVVVGRYYTGEMPERSDSSVLSQ